MALQDIRRVITVHDQSGAAVLQSDSITPHKYAAPGGKPVAHGIWLTESVPAVAIGVADRYAGHKGIAPPNGGTVFTVVDFPPSEPRAATDAAEMQNRIDPEHRSSKVRPPRHPLMHRTRTVDYGIVISGEIDMLLDEGEIHLKAGDVLIQQATNHAWVNRGTDVCRIAFILIDAVEPLC